MVAQHGMFSRLPRKLDGCYPSHTSLGGYPILYVMEDGASLCAMCASGENGSEATTDPQWAGTGWLMIGTDIHWEGAPEVCAHCETEIHSAYGTEDA